MGDAVQSRCNCATRTGINRVPIRPTQIRQPKPGEEVWRDGSGRVQSCELRNNAAAGAGWDVMLLENGEPLFSRQCANEAIARYVAEAAEKDLLRTGWAEGQPNAAALKMGR
jgi:hypothetical protein